MDLQRRKLLYEQMAYVAVRASLSAEFLEDPPAFVSKYGKRPEDITSAELRELYSVSMDPQSDDPVFRKRFREGKIF